MKKYVESWVPVQWKCVDCGAVFYERHRRDDRIEYSALEKYLCVEDFNTVLSNFYDRGKLVIKVESEAQCESCSNGLRYSSILELIEIEAENKRFVVGKSLICGSESLELEGQGFVFRGTDIAEIIPEILLKWWNDNRKIFVINPFVTSEGWKTLLEASELIENYSHAISRAKMARNPFELILLQDSQGYGKKTPKSLLKEAVRSMDEDKTEIERILSNSGHASLFAKIRTTSPSSEKDTHDSAHHRNAGKFHAKLYAGVGSDDAELVLTSYNLTEFELLQMETFSYQKEIPKELVIGEMGKILDDRFMNVGAKI